MRKGLRDNLGKVRTEHIKRIAQELISRYPEMFTRDFESNKKVVSELTNISSKRLRNRVAGYITQLVYIKQTVKEAESTGFLTASEKPSSN